MFDTHLISILFLLTSLAVCLFTLRLIISIEDLDVVFHSLPILTNFLPKAPVYFNTCVL